MELDAKPTETNIVLVNDKILMAVLGANGIKPAHIFMTGWPSEPPEYLRKTYMAYEQTNNVKRIVEAFQQRKVTVDLDEYLVSAMELEGYIGDIDYRPSETKGIANEQS